MHRLAFIVPTKDRREDLERLLNSFHEQTGKPDQVVVVDGGDDTVEDLVASYPDLPLDYVRVYPPGFTKQKNAGASAIAEGITLVGYLDDDIVLEPDAIEAMMRFWESAAEDTGGAGFHITNMSPKPSTTFTRVFGTHDGRGGAILPSGFNVILWPVARDTEVSWLCGGATVWRREIVEGVEHDEWFAGYGHMDDVDYSCMVNGRWRLWVVADARLAHNERPVPPAKEYAFGVYDTVNRYYLVRKYPSRFSMPRFYWATLGKLSGRLLAGLLGDRASMLRGRGYARGLAKVVRGDLTITDADIK